MSNIKYRADIDGLRALAVISVLLFHINAKWLPNGFLGVDIFFVISGYLITTIIYKGILNSGNTGGFSYKEFYTRRIKRILPTFFSVVFVCIIASNLFLVPGSDLRAFEHSTLASVLFLANIFFARGSSYFDISANEKPLLHIWSLSVEEQYYFIAPLVVMLLMYFSWSRRYKYSILLGMACLLLITSFTGIPELPFYYGQVYYLPHLRFVEMLVGSFLAFLSVDNRLPSQSLGGARIVASLSLLVLIACFFAPEVVFKPPYFPGFMALVPCVATAALIWSMQREHWVTKLFSRSPIVLIGKWSYSLYLWHWCVLAYFRYIYEVQDLSYVQLGVALVIIFILTISSYYLIEQRIRYSTWSFQKSFLLAYLLPTSIVLGLYFFPIQRADPDTIFDSGKILFNELEAEGKGILGNKAQTPRVLIAGDSHGAQLGMFFENLALKEGWTAFAICGRAAPFLLDYPVRTDEWARFAQERNNLILSNLSSYDVVIIPGYWGSIELRNTPNLLELIDQTLKRIKQEVQHIYLLNTALSVDYSRYREYNLIRNGLGFLRSERGRDYKGNAYRQEQENLKRIVDFVRSTHPDVHWVDLSGEVPEDLLHRGKPIYSDPAHITSGWAQHLSTLFTAQKPFINPAYLRR